MDQFSACICTCNTLVLTSAGKTQTQFFHIHVYPFFCLLLPFPQTAVQTEMTMHLTNRSSVSSVFITTRSIHYFIISMLSFSYLCYLLFCVLWVFLVLFLCFVIFVLLFFDINMAFYGT